MRDNTNLKLEVYIIEVMPYKALLKVTIKDTCDKIAKVCNSLYFGKVEPSEALVLCFFSLI